MKIKEGTLSALIGQKFGKLTVIDAHLSDTGRQIICTVQCECGSEPRDYPLYLLTSGNTKSCGCSRSGDNPKMGKPKKDIIGMKLNKLTIISEDENTKEGLVKCDCGNEFTIPNIRGRISGLRETGMCKECKAKSRNKKYADIKKKDKFFYFTVLRRVEDNAHGEAQYECQCQCGNKRIVTGKNLKNGKVKSCGCIKGQNFDKIKTLNGLTMTPAGRKLYNIWRYYLYYCTEITNSNGEVIKFFPEWANKQDGFFQFYNWATLKKGNFDLKKRRFLARYDEEKDFTPDNCYFSRKPEDRRSSRSQK